MQNSFFFSNSAAPPPVNPQTPSSRQQSLELAQQELKSLECEYGSASGPDASKLIVRIDQLKNKIAALRGQKALCESNKSSRLISNIMKTMVKEENYEENRRKQLLGKYSNRNLTRKKPEHAKALSVNLEAIVRSNVDESLTPRNDIISKESMNSLIQEDKQALALVKDNLIKREKELLKRELLLQETWMKIPGSKELIEVVNLTLAKLKEQKEELDNERESFEQEKINLFKLRDKVLEKKIKLT